MTKPTTIRLSEDLLKEIEEFVQEAHLDRSAYLREILQKGFSLDKQQRILQKYASGELSLLEVCRTLGWNPWEFLDVWEFFELFDTLGFWWYLDFLDFLKF